ncbi:AraC family transcriptional regulator [Cupriavidus gilardii]|uniref:AraC family transcriptional regulator n=1 Tax=Cupriavidus gilardii TaxID=82541 RepID=UPI00157FF34B|nr:helix-turn-helix domain-containing protein [Cupriavidus gilardii]MCT9072264.1 helix-turn-helix domain-containing protein [Cupriavidus gilardii]QKS62607.1 AraC family transcriptional regulator [Cupriavidus gilardii]UXC35726.1 helix-turn-helix domain-containing protein [Cupriavidus gilardii]
MFLVIAPCLALAPYVNGYWFVQDLEGVYEGQPIVTCPYPGAVLSVNFGRPNAMEGGPTVPKVSLLGFQSASRRWRSWSDTYFVMAMLSPVGLARLFPGIGADCKDRLIDLAACLGDGQAYTLEADLSAAWSPVRIATQLDAWLLRRLDAIRAPMELPALAAAHTLLRQGRQVQDIARLTAVDRRQLHRWFERHLGLGPKQLMDLERLQSSIQAVQRGNGDALSGYSDQAHQIRNWRRRLGRTPGGYARGGPSPLAEHFGAQSTGGPAFYL